MNRDMKYITPHEICAGCGLIYKKEELAEGYCGHCTRKQLRESLWVTLALIFLTATVIFFIGDDEPAPLLTEETNASD